MTNQNQPSASKLVLKSLFGGVGLWLCWVALRVALEALGAPYAAVSLMSWLLLLAFLAFVIADGKKGELRAAEADAEAELRLDRLTSEHEQRMSQSDQELFAWLAEHERAQIKPTPVWFKQDRGLS